MVIENIVADETSGSALHCTGLGEDYKEHQLTNKNMYLSTVLSRRTNQRGSIQEHKQQTLFFHYRTLREQDQREKRALNAIKHSFQANNALLTTKSALTVQ